jgi:tetratricopeptide (TPR) repeat protein
LWFFVTLLPTSSIIPIPDAIFEHRVYLPLAGACMAFPLLMEWLMLKWLKQPGLKILAASAAVVLIVFSTVTLLRNQVWRDDVRLWSDVITKSPHKLRPYNRLMDVYMQRGENEKAISIANLGTENVPEARVSFLDTIGNIYLRIGQPVDAVRYFENSTKEAVQVGLPDSYKAGYFNNLGVGYMALANAADPPNRPLAWRRAQQAFGISMGGDSKNISTLDSFVNVSQMLGQGPAMEEELREKFKASPTEFRTCYSLAELLLLEGRYADSVLFFNRAEELFDEHDPGLEILFFNHALALTKAGQPDGAIRKYSEALRVQPIFNEANYNLALLYITKQDYDSAIQHLTEVLNREPTHSRANLTLARIYLFQGKWVRARDLVQTVLKIDPQNTQAAALWQQIPVH